MYAFLVLLLALLQVVDVYTTEQVLKNGVELNTVMNWLFTKFGIRIVLILKALMVVGCGVLIYIIYPMFLIPLSIWYAGWMTWNTYQLYKAK